MLTNEKQKPRPRPGRGSEKNKLQQITNTAIITQNLKNAQLNYTALLADAERRRAWHRWWYVYCQMHNVNAWPPTGAAVKLALEREKCKQTQSIKI